MDLNKLSKLSKHAKDLALKGKDVASTKGGEVKDNPQDIADTINAKLDKLDSTLGIDSRSMIKESINDKMNKSAIGKIGLAAMNNSDKLGKAGKYFSAANSILNGSQSSTLNQLEDKEEKENN